MLDRRILLSGIWITNMFIYVLGDILRIYSGDMAKVVAGQEGNTTQWVLGAIIMLFPILMVFLSLVLPYAINRRANIAVALGFMAFVIADSGSYPGLYDQLLFFVSWIFNITTVFLAWRWK